MLQKKPVILSFFPTSNHPFLKSTTLAINQAEPSQEVPQVSTSITRDLNRCDPYEHKLTQNRLHIWLCRSSRSKLSAQRMARLQPLAGAPNWRWQYDVIRWCNMMMMRSRGTMFFFFFFFCLWSWWFACWYQWWEVRHALLKYEVQVAVWVMSRQKSCGTPRCMIQGKMTLKTTEMETMYDLGLLGRVERKMSTEKTPWRMSLAVPERECWHTVGTMDSAGKRWLKPSRRSRSRPFQLKQVARMPVPFLRLLEPNVVADFLCSQASTTESGPPDLKTTCLQVLENGLLWHSILSVLTESNYVGAYIVVHLYVCYYQTT